MFNKWPLNLTGYLEVLRHLEGRVGRKKTKDTITNLKPDSDIRRISF